MANALRRNTACPDAERSNGRILEVEKICGPKMSALSLRPLCVLPRLATKLAVQSSKSNGIIES
jgi:hypothetical protein